MHLSNSSYPKILDGARFKLILAMLPSFLEQGGMGFLAGPSASLSSLDGSFQTRCREPLQFHQRDSHREQVSDSSARFGMG